MIVRLLSAGASFKGLAAYLTHDPAAETSERVGWTHTLNLANDHVPSAVDEMLWTARDAELLKQEAGIRAGGRSTENTVKHFSLNWSPDDAPTKAQMIEASQSFLRHMGWQDHQCVLVAHTDKAYSHVHGMLNVVHPGNGLALDDSFERRRAQAWALTYEREQGRIYCEQRLKPAAEREGAPPRDAWLAFQKNRQEFERGENALRNRDTLQSENTQNPATDNDATWKYLKDFQKNERQEFFAAGKSAFSDLRLSIYREVREEFRDRWRDYHAARRAGADLEELAAFKSSLIADQKVMLGERRDTACADLRDARDGLYRDLLDQQRKTRADLRAHQDAGRDNALFLQALNDRGRSEDTAPSFRDSAIAVTARMDSGTSMTAGTSMSNETVSATASAHAAPTGGADRGAPAGLGSGLGHSLLTIGESLFTVLMMENPAPRKPAVETGGPNPFQAAAEEAQKRQQREQEAADDEWRKRQKTLARE